MYILLLKADLVGLKILAKAGYDPRIAIDVWERMAELETVLGEEVKKTVKENPPPDRVLAAVKRSVPAQGEISQEEKYEDLEYGVREFLESLVNSWFGSSHPPNLERIEYMREHMDEAILLYNDALKINGAPTQFIFSEDIIREQQQQLQLTDLDSQGIFGHITQWLSSVYAWTGGNNSNSNNRGTDNNFLISKTTQ